MRVVKLFIAVVLALKQATSAARTEVHLAKHGQAEPLGASNISLRDFISFPVRSQLVACSEGDKILAWAENTEGVLSVKVARESTQYQATTVPGENWQNDAGWLVFSMEFSAACSNLYITVGPSEGNNPLSRVAIPEVSTFVYSLEKGIVSLVFRQALAGFYNGSPCYVGNNGAGYPAVFVMEGGDNKELFAVKLGGIESLSPHPKFPWVLAFSNVRFDHGFIGLFVGSPQPTPPTPATKATITWLATSLDMDTNPVWSPDGSSLAFYRTYDLVDDNGRWPFHAGPAFSVFVAKVNVTYDAVLTKPLIKASATAEIYRDWTFGLPNGEDGYGTRPLLFTADSKRLLFGTEGLPGAGGFLHLAISVPLDGVLDGSVIKQTRIALNQVTDLTPGRGAEGKGCETLDWSLGVGEDVVYVVDNCDLRETRSVAQIALSGAQANKRIALRKGNFTYIAGEGDTTSGIAPLAPGVFGFLASTWNTPTSLYLWSGNTDPRELSPDTSKFNNQAFVVPQAVYLNSSDQAFVLSGQLFVPSKPNGRAILFTHGGSQRQMFSAMHYSAPYAQLYGTNQFLAYEGFLVLSLNYRSGVGYGHSFRACDRCGHWGGNEYIDVLAGGKWLGAQPGVPSARVGIFGLSYGGLNTLQGVTRNSDVFRAGVASAPVFNWISQGRADGATYFDLNGLLGSGYRQLPSGPEPDLAGPDWSRAAADNQRIALDSSPASAINNMFSPLLLIHGDTDMEVDFQESRGVVRALRRRLGEKSMDLVQSLVFPDESHGLSVFENQLAAAQATVDWFERYL